MLARSGGLELKGLTATRKCAALTCMQIHLVELHLDLMIHLNIPHMRVFYFQDLFLALLDIELQSEFVQVIASSVSLL